MATQNFVAGGFYGKLGDMVGQRWRNKRTLRQYVIGANPQTPAQQANRGVFGASVALAQQALNINKGAPAWVDPAVGEFSLRVGAAKTRLQLGQSEAQALPLFPDGYIPQHIFTAAAIRDFEQYGRPEWVLTPNPPTVSRSLSCCFRAFNLLTGLWEIFYATDVLPGGTPCILDPGLSPKYGFPAGAWLEGATSDDALFSDLAFSMPRIATTEPDPITRYYYGAVEDIEETGTYFRVIYTADFVPFDTVAPIPTGAFCTKNGIEGQYDNFGSLTWQGGLTWWNTLPKAGGYTFPAGSYIDGVELDVSRTHYHQYIITDGYEVT
jgi:hypothetical protein